MSTKKLRPMKVSVNDETKITENLFNLKPWFNGIKKFIAIRIK